MRVNFLCPNGSPTRVTPDLIYTRGVGGAELALMSLAEELANQGLDVSVFNNPDKPGVYNGVAYDYLSRYEPMPADVVVLFRVPFEPIQSMRVRKKVFWSCDQFTEGNYRRDVFPFVDKIVCISPRHVDYFNERYNSDGFYTDKITSYDLGVRVEDYDVYPPVERVRNRMIYCSAPDRGLERVKAIWPEIKAKVPSAELYVTFDYRMWGADQPHINRWNAEGVYHIGAVSRDELVKLQLSSDLQLYPCTYDELFCLAVAECQTAGAVPITSRAGAIDTTNEFGYIFGAKDENYLSQEWLNDYKEFVLLALMDPEMHYSILDRPREQIMKLARERFSWPTIAQNWIHGVFA